MIEICDVTRRYGSCEALSGVSLNVEPGRLAAIVGPNGSGKTTLFRLVMGLMRPTTGTISLWEVPTLPRPAHVLGRVAGMLDNHVPPAGIRLQTLLDLKAAATPHFDRWWCGELLRELPGVTPLRRFGELSKGQRQWALAAVVLASRADLLVLDEPADGLDTAMRRRLLALLREAVDERGATVLIASHVLTDLERVADSVLVLQAGKVRLAADLEDLRDQVREVEFSSELPAFAPADEVAVLATKSLSDGTLAWLRRTDWDTGAPQWPGERSRRPVGLEDLYLALVGQHETLSNTLQEIAQCP